MKITVNNLKKLVKRMVRPDENSGKEKDTFEAALKRARDEAKYNLTEELREKYADFLDSPIKEKCILYEAFGGRGMTCSPHAIFKYLLTQTEFQEYLLQISLFYWYIWNIIKQPSRILRRNTWQIIIQNNLKKTVKRWV